MTIPSRTVTGCGNIPMTTLLAGLTTLDVLYQLDYVPDPSLKVMSTEFTMVAGGPTTNAVITYAMLCAASRIVSDPGDRAKATSGAPADSEETPILLAALDEGSVSTFLAAGLATVDVRVVDATVPASPLVSREPIVSSIIEHPSGRMVVSMNTQLDADAERMAADLPERISTILIDGHSPTFAHAALTLGMFKVDGENPFAPLEAHLPHPHTLGDGS